MAPEWDMKCYLDMAANGIVGNQHLVSPFAYSPAVPLIVHTIARAANIDTGIAFRGSGYVMCAIFIVTCFYFARSAGASKATAALLAVTLALNFQIVKWTLFAGAMIDIYVYPLILLAFWLILKGQFYRCLFVSAMGLLFKEFMLLPLATQAAAAIVKNGRRNWRILLLPLGLTATALLVCFVLPRLLIPVAQAVKDYAGVAPIDPFHQPSSLRRLYTFPANLKRDFNIVFAYLSWFLPMLLVIDRNRAQLIWSRLRPYRLVCGLYLAFHFMLVMYGGTNLDIFVTYSLPVLILALGTLLDKGGVRLWEKVLMVGIVVLFNRSWMHIPLPQVDLHAYLNFYGGYNRLVTWRSLFRMAELLICVGGFWTLRVLILRTNPPG
jgi:hypothetical protein